MADALRHGYKELFKRNEYCYRLATDKFKNLVVEVTGKEKASTSVQAIVASFNACKAFADFEAAAPSVPRNDHSETDDELPLTPLTERKLDRFQTALPSQMKMSFGYTINLNLPDTDDPKVYNAIFKALKDNLLTE